MYLTFVAILAVDFHVFPRRFAKTETQGYGLMDLGAGSFVVAAGLVSPRARGKAPPGFATLLKRITPLLGLGLFRLLTTKGLEYQEHVSEYGVHWNFFFTLAVVGPLAAVYPQGWFAPCLLIGLYQYFLSNYNLQEFVEQAPRKCWEGDPFPCNFIVANREGMLGVVGYLVIFLLSEQIAAVCIWTKKGRDRGKWLYGAAALLWGTLAILTQLLNIPVSRRSTNASFCVWTMAHNVLILAALWTVTVTVPPIFLAVNRHGLLVFVLANLLTGLTNLTMNTMEASDAQALLVLFLYLCAVGTVSLLLDHLLQGKVNISQHEPKKD
jgi:phosphatidylinositol glycan class W